MKKFSLLSGLAVLLVLGFAQISYSADIGGFNNLQNMSNIPQLQNPFYDMNQLQDEYRAKANSFNEFQNFDEQKKARQEQIKKENERQQYLEQRAVKTKTNKQFVNDNGTIRIENIGY